jgi:solute carrier family 35 protein E3
MSNEKSNDQIVEIEVIKPVSQPAGPTVDLIPFYLFLNASSSISIVFANKYLFEYYDFAYGTFLTFLHFVTTYIGLEISCFFGLFERKGCDLMKILPLCATFCGFVVLTNLSLQYNSVGFYQLMKVMTTPVIVFLQTLFYGESFSGPIKGALFIICVGVAISTVTDVQLNLLGTLIATVAVFVTSQYQIWVGTKQKELDLNSMQLLLYQAPLSAGMLIPCIPLLDNVSKMTVPSTQTVGVILISCFFAFLVNLSTFLVIGKTSPITYNVLGHFKLTVILVLGFVLFAYPIDYKNLTGIGITLIGIFYYTHLKTSGSGASASKK